ncbi:MAG: hypothetical protein M3Y51_06150 [Actinomycetota bacterium]|nr:hypothetical protein [Actinomycetota bacterium]
MASCGASDGSEHAQPLDTTSTSGPTSTTAAPTTSPAATVGSPYPSDPADLAPCPVPPAESQDEVIVTNSPASMVPHDVPDGLVILGAVTTDDLSFREEQSGGSTETFVATTDGRVTGAVSIDATPSTAGFVGADVNAVVRGERAVLGPDMTRTSPSHGRTSVSWSDGTWDHRVVSSGLSDVELVAFLDRATATEDGFTDPTGALTKVARSTMFDMQPTTTVVLGAVGDSDPDDSIRILIMSGNAESWGLGRDIVLPEGLEVDTVDGRLALHGPDSDGRQRVLTTTRDGDPIDVRGRADIEVLERLARSTLPIESSDPRLVGIPIGDPAGGTMGTWCRTDG